MNKSDVMIGHIIGKIQLFFYILGYKIKCLFIRITKGKEAERAYILSMVTLPQSFYIHTYITRLYGKLGLDYEKCALLIDTHRMTGGLLDNADLRKYTLMNYNEVSECEDVKGKKEIILKYLVLTNDLTKRQIEFNHYHIDQWLNKEGAAKGGGYDRDTVA